MEGKDLGVRQHKDSLEREWIREEGKGIGGARFWKSMKCANYIRVWKRV